MSAADFHPFNELDHMNVFCVFQRFGAVETLFAICEDLGAADDVVDRERRAALENGDPASEWRVSEWPVLRRESRQ